MAMACFMVNDREDTDVANELATSLAPVDRQVHRAEGDGEWRRTDVPGVEE